MSTLSFSVALHLLKSGKQVAREGWNGKGMWLTLSPGGTVPFDKFWAPRNREFAERQPNKEAVVRPYITMKTATNDIVPWVASQTDLLAEDWAEVP